MAIHFKTARPRALLNKFNERIAQTEPEGKITTWVKDGDFYTHKADNWTKKAWFKPSIEDDGLTFHIIKPKDKVVTTTVYGYYHGHLNETFLNHFDGSFSEASTTAKATYQDNCG